jgi:signal transduction histidine kinase
MTANSISQQNLNMRIQEQELDQEMEQLVSSFNRMIERLEQSFAHINEFSSHVAHELKTPLAIIKNELELALNAGNLKEEEERVMTVALKEVDRLIKITKDLLLLAKLEYKLNIFKMEEMDLTGFLKDIYQHSKVLASEKNIGLELEILDHPIRIRGDAVHLRRVFFNLVHNAVKFTPPDGQIKIINEVRENKAFVSVKDTGIGIAVADQTRIFEKFYRIRRADQEDVGGNGLGLCMARAIARTHGGDITFQSEVSKGSIFTVVLPILPN